VVHNKLENISMTYKLCAFALLLHIYTYLFTFTVVHCMKYDRNIVIVNLYEYFTKQLDILVTKSMVH
jgi:hypothetical protein